MLEEQPGRQGGTKLRPSSLLRNIVTVTKKEREVRGGDFFVFFFFA